MKIHSLRLSLSLSYFSPLTSFLETRDRDRERNNKEEKVIREEKELTTEVRGTEEGKENYYIRNGREEKGKKRERLKMKEKNEG